MHIATYAPYMILVFIMKVSHSQQFIICAGIWHAGVHLDPKYLSGSIADLHATSYCYLPSV